MDAYKHRMRRAVLTALAMGAILVTWSELWFYPVDTSGLLLLWLTYALAIALPLSAMLAYGVRRWDGMVLAAALFGFLIEGLPVTVLYEAPPFSYVWTSLAWHGVLSVGIGVVAYRAMMIHSHWSVALLGNVLIGAGLGAWALYSWAAVTAPNGHDPVFLWERTASVPTQFVLGYVVFLIGHLVLDLLSQTVIGPVTIPRPRLVYRILLAVAAGTFALGALPMAFPQSLALVPLAALCLWGMSRLGGRSGSSPILDALLTSQIPLWRYILTLVLPFSAIASVTLLTDLRIPLEANAILIVLAGPLALVLVFRALIRSLFGRHEPPLQTELPLSRH